MQCVVYQNTIDSLKIDLVWNLFISIVSKEGSSVSVYLNMNIYSLQIAPEAFQLYYITIMKPLWKSCFNRFDLRYLTHTITCLGMEWI